MMVDKHVTQNGKASVELEQVLSISCICLGDLILFHPAGTGLYIISDKGTTPT